MWCSVVLTSSALAAYFRERTKYRTLKATMPDLEAGAVLGVGKVLQDEDCAKMRLASVNQLVAEVYAACVDLRELTANTTADETFEVVATAMCGVQKAFLSFHRKTLDRNSG
jgi:hypothetical protein